MNFIKTELDGVFIIEPKVYGDSRGWFMETYTKEKMSELGLDIDFIQENHSMSENKGTLRGLHLQENPKAQSKLVRCTKGRILDVAVDLRKKSKTYKKWISIELSESNKKQLFIPKGFAHGFITLTDNVEVQYKVDEYYAPTYERTIRFDDESLMINWIHDDPILSDKDKNAGYLDDIVLSFE